MKSFREPYKTGDCDHSIFTLVISCEDCKHDLKIIRVLTQHCSKVPGVKFLEASEVKSLAPSAGLESVFISINRNFKLKWS